MGADTAEPFLGGLLQVYILSKSYTSYFYRVLHLFRRLAVIKLRTKRRLELRARGKRQGYRALRMLRIFTRFWRTVELLPIPKKGKDGHGFRIISDPMIAKYFFL